jgi:hypothetical protein
MALQHIECAGQRAEMQPFLGAAAVARIEIDQQALLEERPRIGRDRSPPARRRIPTVTGSIRWKRAVRAMASSSIA